MSENVTGPSSAQDLADMLLHELPAKRWFDISRALGMPAEDAMQDMLAILVIAANERNRKIQAAAGGRVFDDFKRFLEMGFLDLSEAAGIVAGAADAEDGDAGPKSGGGGGGLVEISGPVLPADGGAAV